MISISQIVIVIVALVALAAIIAFGYIALMALRERRSHRRSLPSGMTSNPTRFARFDEEGNDPDA
jgi:hypothetical protein